MATYRFDKDTGKVVKKEDEHPSYVSFLQPHIRSHSNGKHRRTSPKAHSDPTDGTSTGAGGTAAYLAGLSQQVASTFIYTGTFPKGTSQGLTGWTFMGVDLARDEPSPPPIPYAGIRSGEIIGHRLWWVLPDGLYSLAHRFRWEPGATVEGDLEKVVWRNISRNIIFGGMNQDIIYGGVYAYAYQGVDLMIETEGLRQSLDWSTYERGAHTNPKTPASSAIGLVYGTVKLWGEVIEHQTGWRAQFAKLASIDEWWGDPARVPQILEPYYAAHSL